MERMPIAGAKYRHFKNKLYQVITVAEHSETGEKLVIYQALYGDYSVYARPLAMFTSEVNHQKYPDVQQKYRFELVAEEPPVAKPEPESPVRTENVREEKTVAEHTVQEVPEQAASNEPGVHPKLMEFLEADSLEHKYNVLVSMREVVTDSMIDTMAVVMDVVIPEGDVENRYDDLKRVIRTRQQYELSNRLR